MSKNKELVKYFKELFQIEKGARDLYNNFLTHLDDQEAIKQVKKIRDDEEKHMQIVEEIIKIVEK